MLCIPCPSHFSAPLISIYYSKVSIYYHYKILFLLPKHTCINNIYSSHVLKPCIDSILSTVRQLEFSCRILLKTSFMASFKHMQKQSECYNKPPGTYSSPSLMTNLTVSLYRLFYLLPTHCPLPGPSIPLKQIPYMQNF